MSDDTIIMIAGASGQLGSDVAERLATRCGARVVLGSRSPERLSGLCDRVKHVRRVDFDEPQTLRDAFSGVDRLLLISTNDLGQGRRATQHGAAIAAAAAAGVRHVVYTSITRPEPGALLSLAPDHFATERDLMNSGLSWTILRNNCYLDFSLMGLMQAIGRGVMDSAAEGGAIGYVTRADCAAAAAAALEADDFENKVYDITGPQALAATDLAQIVSEITGSPLKVRAVSDSELMAGVKAAGLPPVLAELIVSTDRAAARGHLATVTRDFEVLTGAAPKSARVFFEHMAAMLRGAATAA